MSTPTRWDRVEALFADASERPAAERAAFLDAACRTPDGAPDPDLRAEVERLLATDTRASAFFHDAAPALAEAAGQIAAPPPERVGPWRLVERVGQGGMGTVWRAERADGRFEQTAAVKLMRPGLGAGVLARFRAERQILARLDHPAIARLIDGGLAEPGPGTPDGAPYLVMEFVDGEPITAYCDRRRLSVAARLALFEAVCEAVQFAHRSLVVHRDLKPSNILVAETPEGPRVKLLDFGIAKLLADDQALSLVETDPGQRVMTPEYAAPEQVRGEPVTTATDVYALGVLLYELLTGRRPYGLAGRARHAVEQAILEAEPTRPSTAVGEAATVSAGEATVEAAPTVDVAALSHNRGTDPGRLRRRLAGDLDRIVLKALRKEPARRYASAEAFGRDVERHLAGLPVEAQPDTARYRAGKFVRRHRAAVVAAALALVAVLGGAGVALWQAAEARAQAGRAQEVSGFLEDLFVAARPSVTRGDTLTVFDLLERGVARVDTLDGQPAAQAQLLRVLGTTYASLSDNARADTLLARAFAVRRRIARAPDAEAARILDARSISARLLGRTDEAVAFARQGLAEGVRDPEVRGDLLLALGSALQTQADYDGATAALREALEITPSPFDAADALVQLSTSLGEAGDYAAARDVLERSIPMLRRSVGDDHPTTLEARNNLATVLRISGDPEAAVPIYREVLAERIRVFGPRHQQVVNTQANLGMALDDTNDPDVLDEAATVLGQALDTIGENDQDPLLGTVLYALAQVEGSRDRFGRAEALYRRTLALDEAALGDHPYTALTLNALGVSLWKQARYPEAERVLARALRIQQATLPEDHLDALATRGNIGAMRTAAGRFAAAEPELLHAARALAQADLPTPTARRLADRRLAELYEAWGRPDDAVPYRRRLAAAPAEPGAS